VDKTEALRALATEWRLPLAEPHAQRLEAFIDLLLTWNARINLTGARTFTEVVSHLPDSLAMLRLVPDGASMIDVGSGAGLPAVPFAVLRPDVSMLLVEPRAKRAAFLRTAIRELRLAGVEVENERVEALPEGAHDVAMSRATFEPEEWLGRGLALVKPGGRVLVFATAAVLPGVHARLLDAVSYSATRRPRWLGAYCST
jgi:16S rRNA (guanine527-N7)-methyltransferase